MASSTSKQHQPVHAHSKLNSNERRADMALARCPPPMKTKNKKTPRSLQHFVDTRERKPHIHSSKPGQELAIWNDTVKT